MDALSLKRGDTNSDGLIFLQMQKGKPYWVTPAHFTSCQIKAKERAKKFRERNPSYAKNSSAALRKQNPEKQASYQKEYRKNNKEKLREYSKEYAAKTRSEKAQERNARTKKWRENNPEKVKQGSKHQYQKSRDKNLEYAKSYALENREKVKLCAKTCRDKRRLNDIVYVLRCSFRTRLGNAIRSSGFKKTKSSQKLLDCSWGHFKEHIEKQFTHGMSWENRGTHGWHVDHIIPLSSATSIDVLEKLCHYTNLQPLWAKDNLKKGSKIIPTIKI